MPKAIQYKPNSVVYFAGDLDDRVYLLQRGRVALTSTDIETGKQATEYIREGEFFGVKSALGHFSREESVMVLTDSIILCFSTPEFETFAASNTRIILKMLKVFSTQLRNIHRQTESMLHSELQTNPEDGLYSVAKVFFNSKQFRAAADVGERYSRLYPSGRYIGQIRQIIQNASGQVSNLGGSAGGVAQQDRRVTGGPVGNDPTLAFTLAQGLEGQSKWDEAYKQYHSVIESDDVASLGKAYAGAGRCLYEQDEYIRCVHLLTQFIAKDPKSLQLGEILMYMGMCYQRMNEFEKAKAFYTKARTLAGPTLVPRISELLAGCEG